MDQNDKALIIGGKRVDKISGPVSMFICVPNDDYLREFPYAPILILFGDIHESNKNYCDPVKNKIYDVKFLQLISEAVGAKEEDGTVDFYVEGGELHKMLDVEEYMKEFPMEQLWKLFTKCYFNKTMEGYDDENSWPGFQLIKNIRWQSGDVRAFKKEKEKFNSSKFLKKLFTMTEEKLTESKYEILDDLEILRKQDAFRSSCMSLVTLSKGEGLSINDLDFPITPIEFYNEYIETDKRYYIYKQLSKMKQYGVDTSNLRRKFMSYIENVHSEALKFTGVDIDFIKDWKKFILDIFTFEFYSQSFFDSTQKFFEKQGMFYKYELFSMLLRSSLLDLYTIARIHKIMSKSMRIHPSKRSRIKNTDEVHPLIAICYFGNGHIKNITNHLLEKEKYKPYVTNIINPSIEVNRCLTFSQDYDLDSEISQLKTKRKRYEQTLIKD